MSAAVREILDQSAGTSAPPAASLTIRAAAARFLDQTSPS